ncbi:7252_t:CDS:2 [Cetraspora pellucida]|uniref:7252_t:CDS:1 n=1 Tax=Cetraspora pellucida TaxID=1433469 RepID=A0A9N9E2K9_9GLOM|nr:7252_t:CDS:2 [Cetraspora pellucida]
MKLDHSYEELDGLYDSSQELNDSSQKFNYLSHDFLQEFDFLQKFNDYPQELGDYSKDSIILYKEKRQTFTYKIIKEGIYPPVPTLKYTLAPNKYKIPDNYIVKTT